MKKWLMFGLIGIIIITGSSLIIIHNTYNPELNEATNYIEKEFFADAFQNDYFILDIYWGEGSADFTLIDSDGLEVNKDNIDSDVIQEKYRRTYSRDTRWRNISKNSESFTITRPELGSWKIIASNPSENFKDFSFIHSGTGEHNMWLHFWHKEESYSVKDKITLTSAAGGPYVAKNIEIKGFVYYAEGCGTSKIEEHYEKAISGKNLDFVAFNKFHHPQELLKREIILYDSGLEKHGDEYQGDGRYSNIFDDFFGGSGCYIFEIVADNLAGEGMTVVPGDHPDFVGTPIESTNVPPFIRSSILTIEVAG
jgi:hypothetical protein